MLYLFPVSIVVASLLLGVMAGISATDSDEADEVRVEPSGVAFVETRATETVIRGRPWIPHRRLATVGAGTRLSVRGKVASRDNHGCGGKDWFAVHPFGYVCSGHVRSTTKAPDLQLAPELKPGRRLPFRYVRVHTDHVPRYASTLDIKEGSPAGLFAKGMSLAIDKVVEIEGEPYLLTTAGQWVARDDVRWLGQGSAWHGVRVSGHHVGPSFGWIARNKTRVRVAPQTSAAVVRSLSKRQRVPLLADNGGQGKGRWIRIGTDAWVRASKVNEAVFIDPPDGVFSTAPDTSATHAQWIDVDLGEQVLVAYRGPAPVFATLISTGRAHPTPRGNYPIWAKVTSMKMGNQTYEDKPYLVEGVPWVLLFQGHNALHGAYWHDAFGVRKSHGCVNLSPMDARWVFNWALPAMARGWTGLLPMLARSVVVHVRNSHLAPDERFVQERPVGPPDREEEARRVQEAEVRRGADAPRVPMIVPTLDNLLSDSVAPRHDL